MSEQESEDYEAPHPILERIIEAKQNGEETIPMREVEEAFEEADDPETLDHVKDRIKEDKEDLQMTVNHDDTLIENREGRSLLGRIKRLFT